MKNKKGLLYFLLILILTAVTGIGATMAYLSSVTEVKKNTFSSSKYASILLREPGWDGYTFEDKTSGNGEMVKAGMENDDTLGFNIAAGYLPGDKIPKDPTVKNTADENGVTVYTALKVQYYLGSEKTQVGYEEFKSRILEKEGISFDTKWKQISGNDDSQLFLYDDKLAAGKKTNPLFREVPVNLYIELEEGKLPEFEIRVTAYAIQADNVADINQEMLKFAGYNN